MDRHSTTIEGVTDSYLYLGYPKAFFAWHCEDYYYYSMSYLHFGANKIWYAIPPYYAAKFERMFRGRYVCGSYFQHKHLLVDPRYLRLNLIPVYMAEQAEGEFIITFPRAYHAGFSCGFNGSEATNFATLNQIPFGINANLCKESCPRYKDRFRLDIDQIVKKNLPSNISKLFITSSFLFTFFYFKDVYAAWKRGEMFQSLPEPKKPAPHSVPCDKALGDFRITIPYLEQNVQQAHKYTLHTITRTSLIKFI